MSTKIALLDPLGLPISPEVLWDSFKAVASVAVETIKVDVAGRGLDMSGSLTNFQKGKEETPNVAKSPELIQLEEQQEKKRKRDFLLTLAEDTQNALKFAHTPAVDELSQQVAAMSTEERNDLYNVQSNLNRGYTETTYAKANIGRAIQERREQQKQVIEAKPIEPQRFKIGENDLINNEAHGWKNNPG